jgi:hypothetical protein
LRDKNVSIDRIDKINWKKTSKQKKRREGLAQKDGGTHPNQTKKKRTAREQVVVKYSTTTYGDVYNGYRATVGGTLLTRQTFKKPVASVATHKILSISNSHGS